MTLGRKGGSPPDVKIYLGSVAEPREFRAEFDRETLRALGASAKPKMDKDGLYLWLKETGRESRPIEIDAKTKEKLEALGYLK